MENDSRGSRFPFLAKRCQLEVTFLSCFNAQISIKDPELTYLRLSYEMNRQRKPVRVKFLCWMDEKYPLSYTMKGLVLLIPIHPRWMNLSLAPQRHNIS